MGNTRGFHFSIDEIDKVTDFGTYAIAMYYAKQINILKAKILFEATLSEWKYRVEHELSEDGLDGLEDFEAHFVPSEIEDVISFIENEIVPALSNETQNLLEKYGGRANFLELYYTNPDYLIALGLDDNEFYGDNYGIKGFFIELKEVLSYSLIHNKPCEVIIY